MSSRSNNHDFNFFLSLSAPEIHHHHLHIFDTENNLMENVFYRRLCECVCQRNRMLCCDCRANGVQNTCQNILCVCVYIDTDAKMKIAVRAGFSRFAYINLEFLFLCKHLLHIMPLLFIHQYFVNLVLPHATKFIYSFTYNNRSAFNVSPIHFYEN